MNRNARILIVEDDSPLALLMVSLLTRTGGETREAWNAEKAMRLAPDKDFDLITLDVDLPGTNGFEICSRLNGNSRSSDTPIIFVSGRLHEEYRQRAFELGEVNYIQKPFHVTDFVFRIISHAKTESRPSDVLDEDPNPDTQSLCNPPQGNQ